MGKHVPQTQNNKDYVALNIAAQESWKNDNGAAVSVKRLSKLEAADDPSDGTDE